MAMNPFNRPTRRLTALLLTLPALCASQVRQPAFEVADVRLSGAGSEHTRVNLSNGRFIASNVPLRPLIAEAWSITPDGVIGPGWLDEVRVDIAAKAASPDTPDAELRLMIQSLLEERMKLVSHIENRERKVTALGIGKGGPKLTPSDAPRTAEEGDCRNTTGTAGVRTVCLHMTMARFAHDLPQLAWSYVDGRVVDRTRLQGTWDFALEWTPAAELETKGGLSFFAALQAQLGLELKTEKLAVPVLIIESMLRAPASD